MASKPSARHREIRLAADEARSGRVRRSPCGRRDLADPTGSLGGPSERAPSPPVSHRPGPRQCQGELVDHHRVHGRVREVRPLRCRELHRALGPGLEDGDHCRFDARVPVEGHDHGADAQHRVLLPHRRRRHRSARHGPLTGVPLADPGRLDDLLLVRRDRRLGPADHERHEHRPGQRPVASRRQRRPVRGDDGRHRLRRRNADELRRPHSKPAPTSARCLDRRTGPFRATRSPCSTSLGTTA